MLVYPRSHIIIYVLDHCNSSWYIRGLFVKEYVPRTLLSNQSNTKKFVLDVSNEPTVPVSRYYSSVLGDFVIF